MTKTLPISVVFFRYVELVLIICSCSAFGQTVNNNGCVASGFGINSWLYSNQTQITAPIPPAGTVDWFSIFPSPGGRNVIDQSNPAAISAILTGSFNPTYERRMNGEISSFVDNVTLPNGNTSYKILIDAIWAKDMFGGSGGIDQSSFESASKNGDDPAIWDIGPANVLGKNDIIELGGHMFRDVERASGTEAIVKNDLWFVGLIHRAEPGGDAYIDFEFFVEGLSVTGTGSNQQFSSGGPDLGHTAFRFEPDPTNPGKHRIIKIGDIILNQALTNGGSKINLQARIWVSLADRLSITPTTFDWGPEYDGAYNGSSYVYAQIIPKQLDIVCGFVNKTGQNPTVPPWGAIGTKANTAITNYIDFSISEMSINLTALGLDHESLSGVDPCYFPLNTFMAKARSSNAFTAALKEYSGPHSWGQPSFEITTTNNLLSCNNEIATIIASPQRYDVNYLWSTLDGNILNVTPYNPPLSQEFGNSLLVDYNNPNVILGVINESEPWKINVDKIGSYTIDVELPTGCNVDSGNIQMMLDPSFPLFSGPPVYTYTIPCNNNDGTITASASGGTKPYTFFLYKDNVLQTQITKGISDSSHTFTGLTAGNYRVEVKGLGDCIETSSNFILPARIPVVVTSSITNVNCFGDTTGAINLTVSGGKTPLSYLWNTGNTSKDLLNVGAGTYTVNITDADGCITQGTYTVTQPTVLVATTTKTDDPGNNLPSAAGGGSAQVTASGGTAPYTYLWSKTGYPAYVFSPSNTASSITNLSYGEYVVTITDAKGCTTTVSVFIYEKERCDDTIDNNGNGLIDCDDQICIPAPPLTITASDTTPCTNQQITYTASLVPGISIYEWTVPINATLVSGQNTNVIVVTWQNTSGGQICVRSKNFDCLSPATCINVQVQDVPQQPGTININN